MPVEPLPIHTDSSGPFAGISTIVLEQPGKPVVVLDHPLIQRLEATVRALPASPRGVVLASASERVFVAGADLKSIMELDDDQLARYLTYGSRVFGMLSALPCPTVAAINGAALGGGLELAMHCDGLVGATPAAKDGQPGRPYPVGLPEAGLQICPGWGGTNLLPARMDPAEAIRRTASGQPLLFDEAVDAGLFDAVAPSPAELLETAKNWLVSRKTAPRDDAPLRHAARPNRAAGVLKALDAVRAELPKTDAAAAVAEAVDAGLSRGWPAALEVEQRQLVRLRHTPRAREAINAFFAKSAVKK